MGPIPQARAVWHNSPNSAFRSFANTRLLCDGTGNPSCPRKMVWIRLPTLGAENQASAQRVTYI